MPVERRVYWRKLYTGVTTGSRDGGYPIPNCEKRYTELEDLAKDHGKLRDERYEHVVENVTPLSVEHVEALVAEGKAATKFRLEREQRSKDFAQFQELARKLGINVAEISLPVA